MMKLHDTALRGFVHGNSGRLPDVQAEEATLVLTGPPYFPEEIERQLLDGVPPQLDTQELVNKTTELAWSLRPVFEECYRISAPGSHLVIQTRDVRLRERLIPVESIHRELAEVSGFRLYTKHIWTSQHLTISRRRLHSSMLKSHGPSPSDPEVFLVFIKPGVPIMGDPTDTDKDLLQLNLMRTPMGRVAERHRHQSPIPVLDAFIRTYTKVGDLVVDPFAGGGTTLLRALNLGRCAFGCEINPETFALAQRNLSKEHSHG